MIEAAIAMPSPSVQRAAVAAAGAAGAAPRRLSRHAAEGADLARIPSFAGSHSRRCATSAIAARALFQSALAREPEASARRELLVEVSQATTDDKPSAANCDRGPRRSRCFGAAARQSEAPDQGRARLGSRRRGRRAGRRWSRTDRAPPESRIFAIETAARSRSDRRKSRTSSTPRTRRSTRSRPRCARRRCRSTRRSIRSAPAVTSRRCSTTRSSRSRCASPRRSAGARSRPRITAPPRRRSTR